MSSSTCVNGTCLDCVEGSNVSCAWTGNRPGSLAARPVLTNRMREYFTYGSVGGAGGNPGPYPAANSRPASQFESRGLRRRALVVESRGRYHGGAAVAQFGRSPGRVAGPQMIRSRTDQNRATTTGATFLVCGYPREGMSFVDGASRDTQVALAERTETGSPSGPVGSEPAGGLSGDARGLRSE